MNQSTDISHEPGATFETLLGMLLQLKVVRNFSLLGELQSKKDNYSCQQMKTVFMKRLKREGNYISSCLLVHDFT